MNKLFLIITCLCCSLLVMGQGQIKRHQNEYKKQNVEISKPDGYINGHGYVDLGLPSGTKWATCNVGANEPWNYGNYYSWGETSSKDYYDDTSILSGVHIDQIAGDANYDASTKNWGKEWRMPSESDLKELLEYCKIKNFTTHGVNGILFTGLNGKNIFIPKGGCWTGKGPTVTMGNMFYIWSSNANYKWQGKTASYDDFYSTTLRDCDKGRREDFVLEPTSRGSGLNVRAVLHD